MMSMMRARRILPCLLALPLLAMMAVLIYQQPSPAAAQGSDPLPLPAPTVSLASAATCNREAPRTYLFVRYTAVVGVDAYEYSVKWGRSGSYSRWAPAKRGANDWWPASTEHRHFLKPGDTYSVRVRAVDGNGVKGVTGVASFALPLGDFPAPTQVAVAYTNEEDTAARLTWQGDARSAGWFYIQQRGEGQKWRSGSWRKATRVDGEDENSPYYQDVSGLNPARGYQFRVTGYAGQCGAGSWSDTAILWPVPDPPQFKATVGHAGDGAMLGVWITSPHESAVYHTFRVGEGEAVRMTMPAAQHVFDVKMGKSYRVCATAGNARDESGASCRNIMAQAVSPIDAIQLMPGEQVQGTLNVYWELALVVNPTWDQSCAEGEVSTPEAPCAADSTHYPPGYRVAIQEVGTGGDQWPNEDTNFRVVYQGGPKGGAVFHNLKGNTEYQVALRSLYYGEPEYARATGRTIMNPARDVVVGFDDDHPKRAVVGWQAPDGGAQIGYVVTLRKTYAGRRVGQQRLGSDAVSATFNGLKSGQWYHVNVKAVGEGDYRSPVRACYFQHGTGGTQNTVRAGWTFGPSCAAASGE